MYRAEREDIFVDEEVEELSGAVGDGLQIADRKRIARLQRKAFIVDRDDIEFISLEVSGSNLSIRCEVLVPGVSMYQHNQRSTQRKLGSQNCLWIVHI